MIYNGEIEEGKCLNTRENHLGYGSWNYPYVVETDW